MNSTRLRPSNRAVAIVIEGVCARCSGALTAEFAVRAVDFDRHDGAYGSMMAMQDFGNATLVATRRASTTANGVSQIRLRVRMHSTPDTADGRIEVWCNGEKMIEVSGVRFVGAERGRRINHFRFESFAGGAGVVPPRDSCLQVDDVHWNSGSATNWATYQFTF